jgi:RNA recognition motif-containing protein
MSTPKVKPQKRKSEQIADATDIPKRPEDVQINKKKSKPAKPASKLQMKGSKESTVAETAEAEISENEDGEAKTTQNLNDKKQQEKKSRYILYVTNIPYDASKEDIVKHFGALKEKLVSIRMLTDKGTGQFRGTCFIDCADKESFAVALKLHHTKLMDRKIVVEPTVGGGGKGENRMQRLTHKRQKFSEVRKKRMLKDKALKQKPKPKAGSGQGQGGGAVGGAKLD